jgi:hypothetical protein
VEPVLDSDAILADLASRRDYAGSKKEAVATDNRALTSRDIRLTTFSKLINVYNSTYLSFVFIANHATDLQWWGQVAAKPIPKVDIALYVKEFEGFTKVAFLQCFFSSIES